MSSRAAKKPKTRVAEPFLKWNGGKRQLLPKLLPHVPETFGRYHEPFLGGGALFFALAAAGRLKHGSYLGDTNERLIRTWRTVQAWPDQLISCLEGYASGYAQAKENDKLKEWWTEVRNGGPQENSDVLTASWMIFMNKTDFNGMYRVNKAGKFNVPMGRYKNPTICNKAGLRLASAALDYKTFIHHGDYQQTIGRAKAGDFVYFDCPYAPVSKTSNFTAFTPGGFGDKDQQYLRDAALTLKMKGVHVMISNSSAPLIDKLYDIPHFTIEKVEAKRAINSKADGRGPVVEYIIT